LKDILPSEVKLIPKGVSTFQANDNKIILEDGSFIEYDYLVVAAGIQIDWSKIPGLEEGLQKEDSGIVSIYDYSYSKKVWDQFNQTKKLPNFKMIFTMSPTVIKCAGAPQKIMWLLEDTLRELRLRDRADIQFWTPGGAMFGVKRYSDQLELIRQERKVKAFMKQELVSIDVANKTATFKNLETNQLKVEIYDFLHVAPHMSAPDFIKKSPFANTDGWMAVNKNTLQSSSYPNVFGIGDCTNTPNSKTAAAITSQAPVLVHNLKRVIQNQQPLDGFYNGYASCPLLISKNKAILAEFGYDGKIMETFSKDTGKFPLNLLGQDGELSHRFFYLMKEGMFPFVYWNLWVKGKWFGTNGPFKPDVTKKEGGK
jgi:sulfide:quinone oxidoreductase